MLSELTDKDLLIAFAAVYYLYNASDEKQGEIINEALTEGALAYNRGENFPEGEKLNYKAIVDTWIKLEEEAVNRDLILEDYEPVDYDDFGDTYSCGCCTCCGCTCDDYMWEDDGSFDDEDWGDED
ncbi:hypothetical protein phiM1EF2_028 [Enterococcus phage phiM1EF2]|nr:hypothetical protein phiM1EF2_028 [Enterococcus phage phiM1EF2]